MIAELTLDDVAITRGDRALTYLELEVELEPDGTLADLEAIEANLQAEWGLMPEPRSKFAHGLEWVRAGG
jgi:inorganic triphosphatase YgiF